MPHVAFVTLSGFRVREEQLLELGMTLPGFRGRAAALAELPSLGLLTLAGMLPPHWTCSYRAPATIEEDLVESILDEQPDVVAISALTASILEAYRLSQQLRERGVTTVLGGLHVTARPEEALQFAQSVITGPGESTWPKFLADTEAGSLQRFYRGEVTSSPVVWPQPRLDLLGPVGRYTLQTQRGCPLACDFCGSSRLLGRFQEKPLERIEAELSAICARTPRPLIELADDNTFVGSRSGEAFLSLMQSTGARWFTEADWRLGERPAIVENLGTAGCRQVLMGMESLIFRYPGMGGKEAELQRMVAAADALQAAGVCVNACFIVGAEGETRKSLDRLTEFLLVSPFAEVQVTLQTPFPGTSLFRRLQRENRLLPERDWSYYTLFDVTYQPDHLSVAELEQGFRELLKNVYGTSATQRRQRIRRSVWGNSRNLRTGSDS